MKLGIASRKVDGVRRRMGGLARERREEGDFGPPLPPCGGQVGVEKTEGPVAGGGGVSPGRGGSPFGGPRAGADSGRTEKREEGGPVRMALEPIRRPFHEGFEIGRLLRLLEAEMASLEGGLLRCSDPPKRNAVLLSLLEERELVYDEQVAK